MRTIIFHFILDADTNPKHFVIMEMSSHKDQSPEILPFCCYKHFFYPFNVVFIHEKAIKEAQINLSSFHFISYFFCYFFFCILILKILFTILLSAHCLYCLVSKPVTLFALFSCNLRE